LVPSFPDNGSHTIHNDTKRGVCFTLIAVLRLLLGNLKYLARPRSYFVI
jgi:hypothetical protein